MHYRLYDVGEVDLPNNPDLRGWCEWVDSDRVCHLVHFASWETSNCEGMQQVIENLFPHFRRLSSQSKMANMTHHSPPYAEIEGHSTDVWTTLYAADRRLTIYMSNWCGRLLIWFARLYLHHHDLSSPSCRLARISFSSSHHPPQDWPGRPIQGHHIVSPIRLV
jgi:hypothetical protein